MTTWVFGVGHPDRGDDAVGLCVVDRLARRAPEWLSVARVEGSPLALLSRWAVDDDVIVVDAMRGGRPGSVRRFVLPGRLPGPRRGGGSHDASLADAVELAEALDRLPGRLVVYGVAGRRFGVGEGLDPDVEAAVAPTAARIIAEVRAWRGPATTAPGDTGDGPTGR